MTIETKYNCGDTVFLIDKNMLVERKIAAIFVREYLDNINYPLSGHIYYNLRNAITQEITCNHLQGSLFPSKEELIKSL